MKCKGCGNPEVIGLLNREPACETCARMFSFAATGEAVDAVKMKERGRYPRIIFGPPVFDSFWNRWGLPLKVTPVDPAAFEDAYLRARVRDTVHTAEHDAIMAELYRRAQNRVFYADARRGADLGGCRQ